MLRVAQGGTVRLPAVYRNASNALVDPGTPRVDILDPDDVVVVNDASLVRDDVGEYHYDYAVGAAAETGEWTARFYGVIDSVLVSGDEPFLVVEPGEINPEDPAPILTLAEYKELVGIDPTNTVDDDRINALIPAASRAVRSFTDRKFELASPDPTEREFHYDGSGIIDIDDCTSIVSVTTNTGVPGAVFPVEAEAYTAQPDRPPYYYLVLHSGPFYAYSPEMGFERNLDQYEALPAKPVIVTVEAFWGWQELPEDVKLAAAWMIEDIVTKPGGDNLSSEAIEGFARSWAGSFSALALPNRSRDLLINYQRVF